MEGKSSGLGVRGPGLIPSWSLAPVTLGTTPPSGPQGPHLQSGGPRCLLHWARVPRRGTEAWPSSHPSSLRGFLPGPPTSAAPFTGVKCVSTYLGEDTVGLPGEGRAQRVPRCLTPACQSHHVAPPRESLEHSLKMGDKMRNLRKHSASEMPCLSSRDNQ